MSTVKTAISLTVLSIVGTAWAVPEVSNVRMAQREGSRIVDIWYDLANEEAYITLNIETNGVTLPDRFVTRVTGDVAERVQPGTGRKIAWNAGIDWPEHLATNAQAKVSAWATNNPPLCLVVDLFEGPAATRYPVAGYPSVDALPFGGLTNDLYKSTRLVLRRVCAGLFAMGSPTNENFRGSSEDLHQVTLTQDYYMGVFEVTQRQWERVMNAKPSFYANPGDWQTRPVEKVSYNTIRGSSAQGGGGWPTSAAAYDQSFVGLLRMKTGIAWFDLPTEAQWEYACRAGTTGALNDGTLNLSGAAADAHLGVLARYAYNGGQIGGTVVPSATCANTNGTAKVGSYLPNAWGFYDMHGNVHEWCLDWYTANLGTGSATDPKGAASAAGRVRRGGSWYYGAASCRSAASRSENAPANQFSDDGVRLSIHLP